MNCALLAVALFSVLGIAASKVIDSKLDDVSLSSNDANNFITPLSRAKRGIYHECYEESPCSFEEVEEVFGRTEKAYEYYYTFTCTKYQRNCKVKCTYRKACTFGNWGSWNGKGNGSECFKQERSRPYQYPRQVKYQRWNCNGLRTSCPRNPTETRHYCVCKKALCTAGMWSAWSGDVPQGACATQKRKQPYAVSWTTEVQIGNCDSVAKNCPAPITDYRERCSCKKAVCSLNNWSAWSGVVAKGRCGTQTRMRSYQKTFVYEERRDCSGVSQDCPAPTTESRNYCSCKYATCKLGQWSEWNPKVLESGSCGQTQTRKKSYVMSVAYQDHVGKCPSLPQQCPDDVKETRQQCMCAYRDSCDLKEWSSWSEDVTEEGCKIQTRTRSYVSELKHAQGESCNGLNTECVEEPKQTRTYCKCKHVKCQLGDWSKWSVIDASAGSCAELVRTQSYQSVEVFTNQVDNCNGLATICPADKQEKRTMCKCKTVECTVGDWGPWMGNIPPDTCAVQARKKSLSVSEKIQHQENSCDGLKTSCREAPQETRKMCNCTFREDCTLKEWGSWNGDVPEVGCSVQIRTREYNNTVKHVIQESCSGLDVCPVIRDETRTKCNCNEVLCEWGDWLRTGYDQLTKCYDEVRVKNKTAGTRTIERSDSCDGVNTFCSSSVIEKRKECVAGGGGDNQIITSPPPVTEQTTLAPTTSFKPATYVSIGCYRDHGRSPRPLPVLLLGRPPKINWANLEEQVQRCAEEARKKRFEYFGVQFYAECWSGQNAGETYAKDGPAPSKNCTFGVGAGNTNAVYRLEDLPACSKELKFKSKVSSGVVSEGSWCAGDSNSYQWIEVDLGKPKSISGIGTQGGIRDSWVTVYSLEYSEEGETWIPFKEGEQPKAFAGNSDRFTLENHWFDKKIDAQFLRFKPQSWFSSQVCMTVRVYGCDPSA